MVSVDELVKQLRSRACEIYGQTRYSNYLDKAADKLEELLKKQEELSAEVERVRDGNRYAHLEQIALKLVSKLEAALAERDKEVAELREALRYIVGIGGIAEGNATINHLVSIARRALEGGGNATLD